MFYLCRFIKDPTIGVEHRQIGTTSLHPDLTLDEAIARLDREQRATAAEVFPGSPQRVFVHLTTDDARELARVKFH